MNFIIFLAKKKRKRTTITGDMKPMADTLNAVMNEEITSWDTKGKTEESRVKKVCLIQKSCVFSSEAFHISMYRL